MEIVLLFLAMTCPLFSQESDEVQADDKFLGEDSSLVHKRLAPVDVDFLFHYYEQDGNHSAVTGGIGTEELKDIDTKIIVNIPLDSVSRLSVSAGMNYYSSASTDNIDRNVSSASADDYRGQFSIDFARRNLERKYHYGFITSGSTESDYISVSVGGKWGKESLDGNRGVDLSARVFFDRWMIILPDELRVINRDHIETDNRRSYYFSFTYFQILTKRLQTSVTGELVYQRGLLSTPFHRAFFENSIVPRVERLPDERLKFPLGLRLHYFWGDGIVLRFFYRYYFDSFGINANTLSLETPLKISNFFTIYPFYRFYSQEHSKYFHEYGHHQMGEEYYSSDFDLSSFYSHKAGLGLRYRPLFRIAGLKMPFSFGALNLNSFDLRYANYQREDGLKTFLISTHLGFTLH